MVRLGWVSPASMLRVTSPVQAGITLVFGQLCVTFLHFSLLKISFIIWFPCYSCVLHSLLLDTWSYNCICGCNYCLWAQLTGKPWKPCASVLSSAGLSYQCLVSVISAGMSVLIPDLTETLDRFRLCMTLRAVPPEAALLESSPVRTAFWDCPSTSS